MSSSATCRCGKPADKYSSGIPECWKCWNWRKLDGPAAKHWARVADEFLSNVDAYDLSSFLPVCGLTEGEAKVMLVAAGKVRNASIEMLREHQGTAA